jgi:ferredoxin
MPGACGGTCTCSTCHIIIENEDVFRQLPNPDDREYDMLDMAFGLTDTSRLACQLRVNDQLKAAKLRLPQYGSFEPTSLKS